ncbi:MAG: NAD(P)-dependent oxidoreductase [Deltaproteobacteria bacterium]|nr:NAD(P)-dependent oxidoreductase [Deltaproteobacteria bacterium]
MRIGVTGGSGFLGSVLIPKLFTIADQVSCFDIRTPASSILRSIDPGRFKFHHMDVADQFAFKPFGDKFDFIIHLASVVGYPACNREPALAQRSNVQTTKSVMDSKSANTKVLFSSTISVYGDQTGERVNEDSPALPNSIYGHTKKEAEDHVLADPTSIVFRFAGAFGASPQMRRDNLIHDFCFKALAGEPIAIFERTYLRQFIHIRDMADAMIFAIQNWNRLQGHLYNVGNPKIEMTKADVIECMAKFIKFPYHFDNNAGFDVEKRNYPINFSRFLKAGFSPKVSLETGIQEIINHYRQSTGNHHQQKEQAYAA